MSDLTIYGNNVLNSGLEVRRGNISGSVNSTGSFGSGYIDNKLGIGTSSPAAKLHVNSDISLGADADNRTLLGYSSNIFSIGTRQASTNYLDTVSITGGNVEIGGNISGSVFSTGSFGHIESAGNFIPKTDNIVNLGSAAKRWANLFVGDLNFNNEGSEGNEIDGTTGKWTIQEGEENLYLLNRKNGKRYKFKLEEID